MGAFKGPAGGTLGLFDNWPFLGVLVSLFKFIK